MFFFLVPYSLIPFPLLISHSLLPHDSFSFLFLLPLPLPPSSSSLHAASLFDPENPQAIKRSYLKRKTRRIAKCKSKALFWTTCWRI